MLGDSGVESGVRASGRGPWLCGEETRKKMGEDLYFLEITHFKFRPEKQERKWVKTILSAKIIELFVGEVAITNYTVCPLTQGTLAIRYCLEIELLHTTLFYIS